MYSALGSPTISLESLPLVWCGLRLPVVFFLPKIGFKTQSLASRTIYNHAAAVPPQISIRLFLDLLRSNMADSKTNMQSLREWVVEHKLRTVGCLWLSGIAGSIAYNWSQPNMKTSVKIIHARLHAQALTLAALVGAAVVEYYDHQTGTKADKYAKYIQMEKFDSRKD